MIRIAKVAFDGSEKKYAYLVPERIDLEEEDKAVVVARGRFALVSVKEIEYKEAIEDFELAFDLEYLKEIILNEFELHALIATLELLTKMGTGEEFEDLIDKSFGDIFGSFKTGV